MNLIRFKLTDTTPAIANPMVLFSAPGTAAVTIKNIKYKEMDLIVTREPGDGSTSYVFDPATILFETRESTQTLVIRLVSDEKTGDGSPRFQFHRLESTDLRYIRSVKHFISDGGAVIRSRNEASPDGTHKIEITFEFPGEDPPNFMYLAVHLWDHDGPLGDKIKICDPQVGNDPP